MKTEFGYDRAGSRFRQIGAVGLTVDYERMGTLPRHLSIEGEVPVDDQMCLIVFPVLVALNREA